MKNPEELGLMDCFYLGLTLVFGFPVVGAIIYITIQTYLIMWRAFVGLFS